MHSNINRRALIGITRLGEHCDSAQLYWYNCGAVSLSGEDDSETGTSSVNNEEVLSERNSVNLLYCLLNIYNRRTRNWRDNFLQLLGTSAGTQN
ncbi:hypothetical protein KIL84_015693, partial [Mauremys mutica]